MNAFLSLGRWIFPLPFAILGLMNFMNAQTLAENIVPPYLPMKIVWVYLSGAGFLATAASMYAGKYDKLASSLLAVMLLLIILTVHLPGAMSGTGSAPLSMNMLFKDTGLMAACMLYAQNLAKDRSIIG